jgi:hypothetical protein
VTSKGCKLLDTFGWLFDCPKPKPETIIVTIVIGPEKPRVDPPARELVMAQDLDLQPQKQRQIYIKDIVDDDGDPVEFDGPIAWDSNATEISDVRVGEIVDGEFVPDPEGVKVLIGSFDEVGVATVTGTGDRRKGPETVPASIVFNVTVARQLGDVESYTVEVGEEVDRVD